MNILQLTSLLVCFLNVIIIKQVLNIEALDTRIPILTSASPRSILVFASQCHIISNDSIVNNCIT